MQNMCPEFTYDHFHHTKFVDRIKKVTILQNFAESLQHYLKMCLECDLQYDMETRISERQQNTGIRAVHSNV